MHYTTPMIAPAVLLYLALTARRSQDWRNAIIGALLGLGLTLLGQGDPAARATLDKALKIDPDDLVAVAALAKIALEAKDAPRGIELYTKLLQFNPRDRETHLALASLKSGAGDEAGAAAEYVAVMAIAPDLATAKLLAASYRSQNKSDEEVKALEGVAVFDHKDPAPFLRIAEIRKADKDTEGAENAMRQAAERAPDDVAIHLALAKLIAEGDDLVASIEAFRSAKAKGAQGIDADLAALEAKVGMGKPIVGDATRVYFEVFARLNKRFQDLQKKNPALGGKMRARATIGADGHVERLEMLEDSVHEPSLTALVYFSLKDAKYPKAGTPIWEFVLNPVKK